MLRLLEEHRSRFLAILVLVAVLFTLFVWFGTATYDPTMNNFPGNDEIGSNPDTYTGQEVEIAGSVVTTDPIIVEIEYGIGHSREITLHEMEGSVSEGQHVTAFGTLTDERTLDVERVLVRWPWEEVYMYAVSIIAALWVAGRILRHWTIDWDQLAFVPRGDKDG